MSEITKEQMRQRLGNISHLQDLLFGDKMEEYEGQFEQLSGRLEQLESELAQFRSAVSDRLEYLQTSLQNQINSAINSVEKKIKYLSLTTHEENNNLQEELKETAQNHSETVDLVNQRLTQQLNYLRNDLIKGQQQQQQQLEDLKQMVFERLEKSFSDLQTAKLSRADLAEVLFELCLKVKGTDFIPNLQEANDNPLQADFILPEESTNNESKN